MLRRICLPLLLALIGCVMADVKTLTLTCVIDRCIKCVDGVCSDYPLTQSTPSSHKRSANNGRAAQSFSSSWSCTTNDGRVICDRASCANGVCHSDRPKQAPTLIVTKNCLNGTCIACSNGDCNQIQENDDRSSLIACSDGQCIVCVEGVCKHHRDETSE